MAIVTKIGKCVAVEHRAIRREPIVLRLPMPVSVNNLYLNVHGRGRVPTIAYKVWQGLALQQWSEQKRQHISGPVEITVTLCEPPRARDLDNCSKCLLDFMVQRQIIERDDNTIVRKLTLSWGEEKGAVIRIVPTDENWITRKNLGRKIA